MRTSEDFGYVHVKDIRVGDLVLATNCYGFIRLVLNVRWSTNILFIKWMIFDTNRAFKIIEYDYGKGDVLGDSFRLLSRVMT